MQDHPSFQRCLHLSCTISFFNRCMLQLHWRRLEIFARLDTHPFWMMGTGWYVLIWWSSSTGIMLFVPCYVCPDILHLIYLSVVWILWPLSDQCEEWYINIIWYACRIYLGGLLINLDFQFCTHVSLTKSVLYIQICERSLTGAQGGPTMPSVPSFIRAEMLPSGYLIRPCDGGGCIIHIVDHLDLEVWQSSKYFIIGFLIS